MMDFKDISNALQRGEAERVAELVRTALAEQCPPQDILEEGLIDGMNIIGLKFKNNEIYLPEVLIAARAMYAGMDVLNPKLTETGVKNKGTAVIGTVRGDLHDIGKNLVKMMWEGAGLKVIDLGTDVSADKYITAVQEYHPDILGMSALLTTTMLYMPEVINTLQSAGLREKVKIMIGGAPVTHNYASQIGADVYSPDAATAVEDAKKLLALK
ncbi:MAG TPA: corrinoid protein [Atribacterota bacterium]|nr:corrinoid protein [Atribacterota bacterium]HOR42470.1 corrinoid protein [Atribacterota bacterium]HPK87088.1 corrinoid protein [Atribacterota bacterium]